jgi:hypothetical protein
MKDRQLEVFEALGPLRVIPGRIPGRLLPFADIPGKYADCSLTIGIEVTDQLTLEGASS